MERGSSARANWGKEGLDERSEQARYLYGWEVKSFPPGFLLGMYSDLRSAEDSFFSLGDGTAGKVFMWNDMPQRAKRYFNAIVREGGTVPCIATKPPPATRKPRLENTDWWTWENEMVPEKREVFWEPLFFDRDRNDVTERFSQLWRKSDDEIAKFAVTFGSIVGCPPLDHQGAFVEPIQLIRMESFYANVMLVLADARVPTPGRLNKQVMSQKQPTEVARERNRRKSALAKKALRGLWEDDMKPSFSVAGRDLGYPDLVKGEKDFRIEYLRESGLATLTVAVNTLREDCLIGWAIPTPTVTSKRPVIRLRYRCAAGLAFLSLSERFLGVKSPDGVSPGAIRKCAGCGEDLVDKYGNPRRPNCLTCGPRCRARKSREERADAQGG